MSNALLHALSNATPRETAGSETAARYAFQAHVSLAKLLDLREQGATFCALFDYLDDLVVLDSADDPTTARFYQIKAKASGSWTTSGFCKADGEASPRSIIARMYNNVHGFEHLATSIGFISNAQFKVKLVGGKESDASKVLIVGVEIDASDLEKLNAAVLKDFDAPLFDGWSEKLRLERFSHGVEAQDVFLKGRLATHLESLEVAGQQIPIAALYNVLFNAIRIKIENVEKSQNLGAVLDAKALTHQDLNALFDTAANQQPSVLADWDLVKADLLEAGYGSARIIRLRTAAIKYMRNSKVAASREAAVSLAARTATANNASAFADCDTLKQSMDLMASLVAPATADLSDQDRDAAVLVEAHGAIHGQ